MSSVGFNYKFIDGDTIQKISRRFGVTDWEIIWKHEKNTELRRMRKNSGSLKTGDQIYIPAVYKPSSIPSGFVRELVVHPITIKSLTFIDANTDIEINDSDWTYFGLTIATEKNHWIRNRSHPVVLISNKDRKVNVDVQLDVKGIAQAQPLNAEIHSVSIQSDASIFKHFGSTVINSGSVTSLVESIAPMDYPPQKFDDVEIEWCIKAHCGTYHEGKIQLGCTLHDYYIVYGPPIKSNELESGVTTKRLTAALDWIRKTKETESFEIIKKLFERFPEYVLGITSLSEDDQQYLNTYPELKKELIAAGFPTYRNPFVGAWPLVQYVRYSGECQAIVRLIAGILQQVGLDVSLERKYISANAPDYKTTIISDTGITPKGPDPTKLYGLVDGEVEIGKIYDIYGGDGVGFNRFEAYLKISYTNLSGKKRIAWFGGGTKFQADHDVDATDTSAIQSLEQELVYCFSGLVEFEYVSLKSDESKVKITNVWKYQKYMLQ